MTIYSQHPTRGRIQILATFRGLEGVVSSTVTSVTESSLATPIVDALNRVSALATVPVSVYDRRERNFAHFPSEHLDALTDRAARSRLLEGSHSLWYELVMIFLHEALVDLEKAAVAAPLPVRTAIDAELEAEAHALRVELAEYSEGISPPEPESRRLWEHGAPFVSPEDDLEVLSAETRESLHEAEEDATDEQRLTATENLRTLIHAYLRSDHSYARLDTADLSVFVEPDFEEGYFLTLETPLPGKASRRTWQIDIGFWEPDDPDDEDCSSFTGSSVLSCVCSTPPATSEIVELLSLVAQQPGQLATWSKTPIGEKLAGTNFVVTGR